jgi:Fe-S-cluster containining protein
MSRKPTKKSEDVNSRCLFLNKDKDSCIALKSLDCSKCKFFKNKNDYSQVAETLKHYDYESRTITR